MSTLVGSAHTTKERAKVPLDLRYVEFCVPGTDFYDKQSTTEQAEFSFTHAAPPHGWERRTTMPWVYLRPRHATLPPQGWKIHVSAHPENAEKVLERAWEYCCRHHLPFKFLYGPEQLKKVNAKYTDRGSSGKFITVYTSDTEQLHHVLLGLDELLSGEEGPYILSDIRWRLGPLYVRYGAYTPRFCSNDDGDMVPALQNRQGKLVPDVRRPVFHVPDWVEIPSFLREQLESHSTSAVEFPYRPSYALHYSNGGGVYVARTVGTGVEVVLKEARPYAGLDSAGQDAVTRLRHEARVLSQLAGLPGIPKLYGYFPAWDHHFLAMERINGLDLKRASMRRTPLLRPGGVSPEDTKDYVSWALAVAEHLEETLERIHGRNVVVGDLHPKNIVLRDSEPVFLDFEFSGLDDPSHVALHGAPGFRAPTGVTGREADLWALAAVKLDLFLPHTMLIEYDQGKAVQLAEYVSRRFRLGDGFVLSILEGMGLASGANSGSPPTPAPGPERIHDRWGVSLGRPATEITRRFLRAEDPTPWDEAMRSMGHAVIASATPERSDRLFPGDIEQFLGGNGVCMAYGASGVLLALAGVGLGHWPAYERWLLDQLVDTDIPQGFFTGLHGIAYALDALELRQEATDVLLRARQGNIESQGFDLFRGMAGAGLTLLHFTRSRQDGTLWDEIFQIEETLRQRLTAATAPDTGRGHPGLMRGWSGPALFWLRLYETTGRALFLERAATALRRDLRDCTLTRDGALEADEGWRTLPYLHTGGVGVGIVLTEYLRHASDEEFLKADRAIEQAAGYEYYGMPTISFGSTGILLYLANKQAVAPSARTRERIQHILSTLRLHALPYEGHIAFRGNQSLRLSMDLATGTSGIMLAVHTALYGNPGLPFLPPGR